MELVTSSWNGLDLERRGMWKVTDWLRSSPLEVEKWGKNSLCKKNKLSLDTRYSKLDIPRRPREGIILFWFTVMIDCPVKLAVYKG